MEHEGNGSWVWVILLAFLFMRGGWDGRDGHHDGGDYERDHNRYDRRDADFRELRTENWQQQKEILKSGYEDRIADLKCCCETNQNIKDVKCEVAEQGEKTRALMISLEKDETIRRQADTIAALQLAASEDRIVDRLTRQIWKSERFEDCRRHFSRPDDDDHERRV